MPCGPKSAVVVRLVIFRSVSERRLALSALMPWAALAFRFPSSVRWAMAMSSFSLISTISRSWVPV